MFSSMDADGDGKVSKTEHAAAAQKKFSEADMDRDGQLVAAEIAAMHPRKDLAHERSGAAATPGKSETAKVEKSAKTAMSSEEMIKKHDKNNDGKLSAAEHAAASEAKFASLDTNKDGSLTLAECEAGEKM
jgi:Ca2+-binding EF-hand superfamily protein